ncbi:MAG TPA: membrane protein insertase YidC [Terriglobales bacterium]|nr:membrane protein insertase YidC [Terriglobales bacterium]
MADFQNPQHEPGSEKRMLLAFALTMLILLAMQPFISRYTKQQTPAPTATQPAVTTPAQGEAKPAPPAAPAGVAAKAAAAESETVVENDLYKITFTNRGAQVKSWILKNYRDDKGNPLELVNAPAAAKYGYPLSLWSYDEGLRKKLSGALYVASATGEQHAPVSLTYEYSDGGTIVRKTFSFDHSYVVKAETSVYVNGSAVQAYPAWPAGFGDQTGASSYAAARIDYQSGDTIERIDAKKVSGGNTLRGPFHWAGAVDQYFAAVFLPSQPEDAALVTLHEPLEIPKDLEKPDPTKVDKVTVLGAAVGNVNGPTEERIFVGPKALDVLRAVHASLSREELARLAPGARTSAEGPNLEGLVDFGKYLGFIAKPLFLWLKWTHDHWVANWGWSIVVLTLIINIAMFPLKWSSMKSSLKMAKIAPQIKAIQEKYKKYKLADPRRQEMNQEISALYKKEGANPVGGCIPMALQMPFLIAFYSMLGVGIELRQAAFLWIRDLSSPDPYHILPIAIIITMYLLQKMTPAGGMDPVQQKMMSVTMPIFLGVISWSLSAGLCVYWVLGNVIGIVQQMVVNRTKFGREMREHMEKQARKRAQKS